MCKTKEIIDSYIEYIQESNLDMLSSYDQAKIRLGMLYFDRIRIGIESDYKPLMEVLDSYTFEPLPQLSYLLDVLQ